MAGELDMPDFRSAADALADQLNTQARVIDGAGHLAPLEQPGEFHRVLLEFLREQEAERVT